MWVNWPTLNWLPFSLDWRNSKCKFKFMVSNQSKPIVFKINEPFEGEIFLFSFVISFYFLFIFLFFCSHSLLNRERVSVSFYTQNMALWAKMCIHFMCIISIIITNKCLLCAVKWLEPVKALSISMHWFTWPSRARGHMPSNDGMQSILMLVCMSKCWLQNWWRQTNKNLIASHHNCYTLAKTKILTVAKQSLHCYIPISNNLHSQLNPDNHIWRTNVKRSKLNSSKARARKSEREKNR